jgi:hypothetical protein
MMTDTEYEMIQAKIAELQNDNYASPEAAQLQAWLGEVVVQEYLDSLSFVDGEVIASFELDE